VINEIAEIEDLLAGRTLGQLRRDYREARRQELAGRITDCSEVRRWITVEMIRRVGRERVAVFERLEREWEAKNNGCPA